ncbi:hypothetical protein [Algihabitans albus]|uniref:hypothetical protein n=1 Tax=Algihabitans albus TaxID=2164067 RepID=UPI000E5D1AC2|nr:hypothetical protein [Algihabitans albus]
MRQAATQPGVWGAGPEGSLELLLEDDGGDWSLEEVPELFGLGRTEEDEEERLHLILEPREARQLKPLADAHSFDHDEGLIQAMLAMARFAQGHPGPELRFLQIF